ncbi:hypothetical protein KUTeg_010893 [Tegillarca granosa]|uniref:Chaoptin n=1 Tax=Tegillarca granosa TaxID=220873 RepID=A0ABQ9F2A4_TEGGR|nr:hypothetical protein KUTeg_010893 [Tegillarca granosa]
MVSCLNNGKKLNYIPLMPIRTMNLYYKDLSNNSIITISQNAFSKLTYLRHLQINNNNELNSTVATNAFSSLSTTHIESLHVDNMGWNQITPDFFENLDFPGFEYISLSKNNLKNVEFSTISSLRKFSLINNIFSAVPNFCKDKNNGFFPKLEELYIRDNIIHSARKDAFMCLENLKHLDISSNPIRIIKYGLFLPLKSLGTLVMRNFDRFYRTDIEPRGLMSNTLKEIQFSGTFVVKDIETDNVFDFSPNIQILEFYDTYMSGDLKNYKRLFSPLKRLGKTGGLSEMPTEFFTMFPKLKKIDLLGNKISSWNGRAVFGNMTTIGTLNLS